MNAKYTINGVDFNVAVNSVSYDRAEVTVNGVTYQVQIGNTKEVAPTAIAPVESTFEKPSDTEIPSVVTAPGTGKPVNSPLPGVIVEVKVKVGDRIRSGQVVAVLEAMKMENEIQTEYDGVVVSVNVSQGDSIMEGAPIVTIG